MRDKTLLFASIIVTLICWSSAFVAIAAISDEYSPGEIAFIRFFIAAILMTMVGFITNVKLPSSRDLWLICITGFVGITCYNLALNLGLNYVTSGTASFIVNTVPLFTAVFAYIFLKEKQINWFGLFISFVGVALLLVGESKQFIIEWGVLIVLIAAISQAIFFILQKPLLKKYRPLEVTIYSIWAGTLFLSGYSIAAIDKLFSSSSNSAEILIFLGFFPSALAYLLWAYNLKRVTASKLSSYLYFVPGLTLIIGWIWLGEIPHLLSIAGGLLTLVGVMMATISKRQLRFTKKSV